MSTPHIYSASSLRREIDTLKHKITQPETEESWDSISDGLARLAHICSNGGGEYPEELIPHLRTFARPICSAMSSERTRLSGAAIDVVTTVAQALGGTHFEPLLPLYFPTLLILSSRTNRVIATRARACILAVIEATQLPVILTYFVQNVKDKSNSLRLMVADGTLCCLNCFNPPDVEKDNRAQEVETIIRTTARDANADVRKAGKRVFEAYKQLLADRLPGFAAPLTPTIKKYLNLQNMPSTSQSQAPPPRIDSSARPRGQLSKTRSISNLASSASSAPAHPPPRPLSRAHAANLVPSTGPSRATRAEPLATSSSYKEPQRIPPARTRTTSTTHSQPPSAPSKQPPQVIRPQRSIIGRTEHNGNLQASSSHAKPVAVSASTPTEAAMKPSSSTQFGPRRVHVPQLPPAPPEPLRAPTPVSSATIPAAAPAPAPAPTSSSSSTSSKPAKVATSSAPAPTKPMKKPMLPPPVPTARERTMSNRSGTSATKLKPDSSSTSAPTSATTSRGKERSLTQPTLSQLARMQTKKPTAADNKAATKPSSAASSKAAATATKPATSKASGRPQPTHVKTGSTATVSSTSSNRSAKSNTSSGSSAAAKAKVASKTGVLAAPVKGKTVSSRPTAKTQKLVEKKEPEEVPLPPSPVPGVKEEKPQEDVEVSQETDSESGTEVEIETEGGEDEHDVESADGERESHDEVEDQHAHVDGAELEDEAAALPVGGAVEQDEQHDDEDMDMSEATIIHNLDYKTNGDDATPEDDDEDVSDTPRQGSPVVEHHLSQDLTTLTMQVNASAAPDSLNPFGYPTPPVSVSGSLSPSTHNQPSQNGIVHLNGNGNGNGNHDSNPALFATPHNAVNPDDLFALHSQTAKTPISALLSSIHHGFLFSPSSPLSPPSSYIVDPANVVNGTHGHGQNVQPPLAKPQFGGSLNVAKAYNNFNGFGSANGWNMLEKQIVVKELEAESEEEGRDGEGEAEKDMPREILKVVDVN